MNREQHRYDLSFASSYDALRTFPEITFTVHKGHLPEIFERLAQITKCDAGNENQYFNDPETHFTLPFPDLFGNIEFGYDNCGYCSDEGDSIKFHVEIIPNKHWPCSLTIHILCRTLSVPFEESFSENKTQQLVLDTVNKHSSFDGHAVCGDLSTSVTDWLGRYATDIGSSQIRMHPDVVTSMNEVYLSLNHEDSDSWVRECGGSIRDTGHFTLSCPGNSCDLSVYPDQRLDSILGYVNLECHNLDTAVQQLMLLAGIAKICDLVRTT